MRARDLIAVLPLLLAACTHEAPTPESLSAAATKSLNSGEYETARTGFEHALELIGGNASHPQFLACAMGSIEAQVRLNPEKAERELMQLAQQHPGRVRDRDYSQIATLLAEAKAYQEAVRVLDAGRKAHPDSELIVAHMARLQKEMEQSGNQAGLKELAGLGYMGDE